MLMLKRTMQILAVALFVLPVTAYADSWSCSKDNDVREVHIIRTTSEPVPCHVLYRKQTEGFEDQIPWRADYDENFCEDKAKTLISQMESWGWVCAETVIDNSSSQ